MVVPLAVSAAALAVVAGNGRQPPAATIAQSGPTSVVTGTVYAAAGRSGPPAGASCVGRQTIRGDVDGDGRTDLVYHDLIDDNAVLGVCTASGITVTAPGMGQSEVLELIDVDRDGRYEIVFGATSVNLRGANLAVMVEGQLRIVELGHDRLSLLDGWREDNTETVAYGCTADGALVLVMTKDDGRDGFRWYRDAYVLHESEGRALAVKVSSDGGTRAQTSDLLTHARALTEPCPG